MDSFSPIGQTQFTSDDDSSFWPSFTDIMMVVTMIFLLATTLLIARNWQLVNELQQSMSAERLAAQVIETTNLENATLEEQLTNAQQMNSILRLRLLDKDEQLRASKKQVSQQTQTIALLKQTETDLQAMLAKSQLSLKVTQEELDKSQLSVKESELSLKELQAKLKQVQIRLTATRQTLQQSEDRRKNLISDIDNLNIQLAQLEDRIQEQTQLTEEARDKFKDVDAQILALKQTADQQIDKITRLTEESEQQKKEIDLLNVEKAQYNEELLTLKGDYEVVKSKYEQLIRPARSAKGKYIAEVFYVRTDEGKIIKFKEAGDKTYKTMSLAEVEARLNQLRIDKGPDLYVKIIIPQNSGLNYNEAWNFMTNLLQKYDYYYQN